MVFLRDIRSQLQYYTIESFEKLYTADFLLDFAAFFGGSRMNHSDKGSWSEFILDSEARRQLSQEMYLDSTLKPKLPAEIADSSRNPRIRISLEHLAKEHILTLMREIIPNSYREHSWKVADMFFRNRTLTNLLQTNKFYNDPRIFQYLSTLHAKLAAKQAEEEHSNQESRSQETANTAPPQLQTEKTLIEDVERRVQGILDLRLLYFSPNCALMN
jgi:hypothetical protein